MITIHLGDQTDSKVLLGTYVATSQPGHFEWQPGVLTMAVQHGKWVVFEDIDLAPGEVISVLLPLLESSELFIPSRGERIKTHSQFLLFATRSLIPGVIGSNAIARPRRGGGGGGSATTEAMLASSFWTKIDIEPLDEYELSLVIQNKFPRLAPVAPTLIHVFQRVSQPQKQQQQEKLDESTNFEIDKQKSMWPIARNSFGRFMTARDLLKWSCRIDNLIGQDHKNSIQVSGSDFLLNDQGRQWLFKEAIDCFCAMESSYSLWLSMLQVIGSALNIPTERVNHFAQQETPNFDRSKSHNQIGRCILPCNALSQNVDPSISSSDRPFAETRHARRLMERIAMSAKLNEPILLVGETGTGKTTVVQRLADLLHQRLVVVNLSQQSDSSVLLGGFKPVDTKTLIVPLKEEFDSLFEKTFSIKSNTAYIEAVRTAYGQRNWRRLIKLFSEACPRANKLIIKARTAMESNPPTSPSSQLNEAVEGPIITTTNGGGGGGDPASKRSKKNKKTSKLKIHPDVLDSMWRKIQARGYSSRISVRANQ